MRYLFAIVLLIVLSGCGTKYYTMEELNTMYPNMVKTDLIQSWSSPNCKEIMIIKSKHGYQVIK